MNEIVLFGDSYTAGRLPHSQTDGALSDALNIESDYCLAKSGSTAQEWAINKDELLHKVLKSDANIAVGSLGGNDLFVALSDGVVTFFERIAMMGSLYAVLKKISDSKDVVILMLYPDPFNGTKPEAIDARKQLTDALTLVVNAVNIEKGNVQLLDLSLILNSDHFDNIDIHPNAEGYKVMAKAILDMVSKIQIEGGNKMRKMIKVVGFVVMCGLLGGCQFASWKSEYGDGNSVSVLQGSFLTKNTLKDATVNYNGVVVKLSDWGSTGDVEMTKTMGEIAIYAMASYMSMGSVPAIEAILQAFGNGKAQSVIAKVNSGIPVTKEDFEVAPVGKGVKK